ncbi:class II aldolase/adducin family protein [Vannielia litorea]|uniref:Class II Aldolase and Adducin N-terminal domain-containing protein n=1 Tax=Vannielia litorea TaxID=1217970 RepID=A0A1N6HFY9_9RHOB|nr:class II aldolase/adducin family protein [Vannielia litorea]SIO18647.1 Class II Aldolase and Adducin N-terminal domain-containing protein [Vannielia litorea]
MQKGLFSSLPSISNWPDRTDLSAASGWAARNGLGEPGDFLALLKADGDTILVADGSGAGPDAIGTEPPYGMGTALAAALGQTDARCLIFARPPQSVALAALAESLLPPICTDSALFHHHHVVDPDFGGRPPEEEGPRLSALLVAPGTRAAVIGNHGVLTLGPRVSHALLHLHRFERAAGTYLRALATGHALRILPDELATSQPAPDPEAFFAAVKAVTGD